MPQNLSQQQLKKLRSVVQDMIDADASDDEIKGVVSAAQNPNIVERLTSPLVPQIADAADAIADHLDAPALNRSETKARIYGFIAGATQGAGGYLASLTSPVGIALSLAGLEEGGLVASKIPALKGALSLPAVKALQQAVQSTAGAAFTASGAYNAATAQTLPEAAQGVADVATGMALGTRGPNAPRILRSTRGLGQAMIDKSQNASPLARGIGAGVVGGSGYALHNPALILPGAVAGTLGPELVEATGRGMVRLGTPKGGVLSATGEPLVPPEQLTSRERATAEDKLNENFVRNIKGKETRSLAEEREAKTAAAKTAKETENAQKLTTLQGMMKGQEPGEPSLSKGLSATDPTTGETYRASIRVGKPKAEAEAVDPMVAIIKKQFPGISDADAVKAASRVKTEEAGGPARPGIRVGGKAAQDLAEGKVPKSGAPVSDTRQEELLTKFGGKDRRLATGEAPGGVERRIGTQLGPYGEGAIVPSGVRPTEMVVGEEATPHVSMSKEAEKTAAATWSSRDWAAYDQTSRDHPNWTQQQKFDEVARQSDIRRKMYMSGELKKEPQD